MLCIDTTVFCLLYGMSAASVMARGHRLLHFAPLNGLSLLSRASVKQQLVVSRGVNAIRV